MKYIIKKLLIITRMNNSTIYIIDQVFEKYIPIMMMITNQSIEIGNILNNMHNEMKMAISSQYMNTISKFMCHKEIELDEILSSSPPQSQMISPVSISTISPVTPEKIHKRLRIEK